MSLNIAVLYGTETGNAEYCADILADRLRDEGLSAKSIDMENFDPKELETQRVVLIVTSTYGNGDAPSNAEELLEYVQNEDLQLSQLNFGVCALGDKSFTHFAQCGKDFETALLRCKAKPMFDRVDCDAHFEPEFEAFTDTAVDYLVTHKDQLESGAAAAAPEDQAQATPAPAAEAKSWTRDRPFRSAIVAKRLLSKPGSNKETMHYEFDLSGSDIEFEVGDCFGVHPSNRAVDRAAVLEALGCSGSEPVVWQQDESTVGAVLELTCLQQVTVALGQLLATQGSGPAATAYAQGEVAITEYLESVHVVDALTENSTQGLDLQAFVKTLRKLQPRLFSVASSPQAAKGKVAFTIETLRYQWREREVHGVATCWLADRMQIGDSVGMYLVKNESFRFAQDSRPVIMVGPGTGVAPFRGYLEELEVTQRANETWLFFGHQHQAYDFLYEDELARWSNSKVLNRSDYAWSRDQDHKVYVQNCIAENATDLWAWMQRDAVVYVCGDATGMAPAVAAEFGKIAESVGGVSDGASWLEQMVEQGRYKTDVY